MTQKTTKKALIASALSMLLCVSMLIGTTFAWFTDEVTSGKNQIIAGNLDVELEYAVLNEKGEVTGWVPVTEDVSLFPEDSLWEPGHTEVVYLHVTNKGNLALKYQLMVNVLSETTFENALGEKDCKLSDYLVFGCRAKTVEIEPFATREEAWEAVDGYTWQQNRTVTNTLGVGVTNYVALVVYMPTTVGNEANYRGDVAPSIDLGINLFATQATVESDSFGTTYDENAEWFRTNIPFTSDDDLDAFDPKTGLEIDNGKANVTAKGAQFTQFADFTKHTYTLEYDVDASGLADGEFVTFDAGHATGLWDASVPVQVRNNSVALHYSYGVQVDPVSMDTSKLHVTHTYTLLDGKMSIITTVTDGSATATMTRTSKDSGSRHNVYWNVNEYTTANGEVAISNFTFYTETAKTYVGSAVDLKNAFNPSNNGKTIVLADDIVVDEDFALQYGRYMFIANGNGRNEVYTLDLNGKTITVKEDAPGVSGANGTALFTTANGGTLNVIGEGTIVVEDSKTGIFWAMNEGDQINIYGGTYISNSDATGTAILYTNSGNIDVYGGKFISNSTEPCANAENAQGDRLSIVFHEGVLLNREDYQRGDSTRIQLAEGCSIAEVKIDGETWYQVVAE